MNISIITVVYNAELFIKDCIESIINQSYEGIEYIIIDGGSSDQTLKIIDSYKKHICYLVSEKDKGLYDAINKGIHLATGEIIGLLNADDILADENVISKIVNVFEEYPDCDGVYGHLNYIKNSGNSIVRKWKSRQAGYRDIEKGWMPAHPTLYLKKTLFKIYGNYALDMGTSADYDLILRYFYTHKIKTIYLPILIVNMRLGGVSNKSFSSRINGLKDDYRALKRNKVPNAILVLLQKKVSKLLQFF